MEDGTSQGHDGGDCAGDGVGVALVVGVQEGYINSERKSAAVDGVEKVYLTPQVH